jgi:hypothetical protein
MNEVDFIMEPRPAKANFAENWGSFEVILSCVSRDIGEKVRLLSDELRSVYGAHRFVVSAADNGVSRHLELYCYRQASARPNVDPSEFIRYVTAFFPFHPWIESAEWLSEVEVVSVEILGTNDGQMIEYVDLYTGFTQIRPRGGLSYRLYGDGRLEHRNVYCYFDPRSREEADIERVLSESFHLGPRSAELISSVRPLRGLHYAVKPTSDGVYFGQVDHQVTAAVLEEVDLLSDAAQLLISNEKTHHLSFDIGVDFCRDEPVKVALFGSF